MTRQQAYELIKTTFTQSFDKDRFAFFINELLNGYDQSKATSYTGQMVKHAFKEHVNHCHRLGTYTTPQKETIDILTVHLTKDSKLEKARTAIRNYVAYHLDQHGKDAALVAFVSPSEKTWRFSYVKLEYKTVTKDSGKIATDTSLTPARRFSYIVGEGESCHTAQTRFVGLLENTLLKPSIEDIQESFSVETVTKEFFEQYVVIFKVFCSALENAIKSDSNLYDEFSCKNINQIEYVKKLMGQIVFLYFLQRKGWLGVPNGSNWGEGPKDFLRKLANKEYVDYVNFHNDVLQPLFYDTLATDRGHEAWSTALNCRIPFLNGGLFEPIEDFDWIHNPILLPNALFTNNIYVEEQVYGTGILDVFDRYNFTVNEAEPLEKEVAIDPEMLGKIFENLIEENLRKGLGSFYTPREIVHYMCCQSLVIYLVSQIENRNLNISREDINVFIDQGDQAAYYESSRLSGLSSYKKFIPDSIHNNARLLDELLSSIQICDPAVGSGAFLVGMMHEVIRCRVALTPLFNDVNERSIYHFKRHAINHSLHGVDIDQGAVETAKLRLWLSLVVDEENVDIVKPLPNLDYKIVVGNSLQGVDRDALNNHIFKEIEQKKEAFFSETDHSGKIILKREIDNLLQKLMGNRFIFDYDIFFSEVFDSKNGFDIVIANPPYGADIDSDRKLYATRFPKTTKKYKDIYKLFIELGLSKLCNSLGLLCFITPNTIVRQVRYEDVRKYLLDFCIIELVNLGEGVFENVVVPTCFFFVGNKSGVGNITLLRDFADNSKYLGLNRLGAATQVLQSTFKNNPDCSFIQYEKSILAQTVSLEEIVKFKDAGINYQRVNVGLSEKGKSDLGQRLLYKGVKEKQTHIEFWKGEHIHPYAISQTTGNYVRIETINDLNSNERVVLNRSFFDLTPKLVWRQTASYPIVAIDYKGIWFGRSVQAGVINSNKSYIDYKFLCGILNSKYVRYQYGILANEEGRVFPQIKWAKLRHVPIPDISKEAQVNIITYVSSILEAIENGAIQNVKCLIDKIDRETYKLYGLSESEIHTIEDNAMINSDYTTK